MADDLKTRFGKEVVTPDKVLELSGQEQALVFAKDGYVAIHFPDIHTVAVGDEVLARFSKEISGVSGHILNDEYRITMSNAKFTEHFGPCVPVS
jgi:hypothetical protein